MRIKFNKEIKILDIGCGSGAKFNNISNEYILIYLWALILLAIKVTEKK